MLAGMELDMFQGIYIYSGSGRARWSNGLGSMSAWLAGKRRPSIVTQEYTRHWPPGRNSAPLLTCKVEVLGHVLTPRRGGQEGAPGGRQGVGAD